MAVIQNCIDATKSSTSWRATSSGITYAYCKSKSKDKNALYVPFMTTF